MKKKNRYNPFYMVGSWIGFVIFTVYIKVFNETPTVREGFINLMFSASGFLLGWGINSLLIYAWRKLK